MTDSVRGRRLDRVLTAALLLMLLVYLVFFALVDFRGFPLFSTADMYQDTLAARLMWEKKSLFPDNYLFGNQFYVLSTPVAAALFYGLTGSMNTAMALATLLMSALVLWSLDWMLRPWTKTPLLRAAVALAAVGLLFGPASCVREDGAQLFYVMCSFYACYAVTHFVVLGDYARARAVGGRRLPALSLALALCFAMGMQSARQTCVTVLPLLGLEALRLLLRLVKRQPPLPEKERAPLLRVGAYTLANLAGMLCVRAIHPRQHSIYGGSSLLSGASLPEKLREMHAALSGVSGLEIVMGSEDRLFFALMFGFCLFLVLAAARRMLLSRGKESEGDGAVWLVTVLALLAVLAAFLLTEVRARSIYLFLWYFLPALSLPLIARRSAPRTLRLLLGLLLVLAALNFHFSYRFEREALRREEPPAAQSASRYAVDHGYELVYGNHENACEIAVWSDGALTAGCWDAEVCFKIVPYTNIRDIYHLSDYARAVYVMRDYEAELAIAEAAAGGVELRREAQFGPYGLYSSSGPLLYPLTDTIDYGPWRDEY